MKSLFLTMVMLGIGLTGSMAQSSAIQQCARKFADFPAVKKFEGASDLSEEYRRDFLILSLTYKYCYCQATQKELKVLEEGIVQKAKELKNIGAPLPFIPENASLRDKCAPKSTAVILAMTRNAPVPTSRRN